MPERHWREALKLARIAPVLMLAAMLCTGCTALGFMAGRSLDAPRLRPLPLEQLARLRPGEYIEVTMLSGDRWGGRLLALVAHNDPAAAPDSVVLQVTAPPHSGSIIEPAALERRAIPFEYIARVSHAVPPHGAPHTILGARIGLVIDALFVTALLITAAHARGHVE